MCLCSSVTACPWARELSLEKRLWAVPPGWVHLYVQKAFLCDCVCSSRNAGSFCTPAHLKIFALISPMYFSFLIHEVEMIVLICLPHKFVERINWCLYRVLEPYANIKVILNRFFGITEPSNKRSWRLNYFHALQQSELPGLQQVSCSGGGIFGASLVPAQRCAPCKTPLL